MAIPRAQNVIRASEGSLEECIMISDAFFPFRDTVDAAHAAGIRWIIQPGGSQKDAESIAACDEHRMGMAFTGKRQSRRTIRISSCAKRAPRQRRMPPPNGSHV